MLNLPETGVVVIGLNDLRPCTSFFSTFFCAVRATYLVHAIDTPCPTRRAINFTLLCALFLCWQAAYRRSSVPNALASQGNESPTCK